MTLRCTARAALVRIACVLSLTAWPSGEGAGADQQPDAPGGPGRIVYVPPDLGAPPTRTSAAVRGDGEQLLLQPIAPEQTGLTLEARPTLHWFVTAPTEAPLEVTVIEQQGVEPLLELDLGPAREAGWHALPLADHGLDLQPDRDYRWSVALVPDPAQRSADLVSGATIRRVLPDATVSHQLEQAHPMGKLEVLARHGYWYDLITLLSVGIATEPDNAEFRRRRAELMEQVGLEEAAAADRLVIEAD